MASIGGFPNAMVDFQSYAGPGDKGLRNTELEGYQPVSRIGEVVMNSFGAAASRLPRRLSSLLRRIPQRLRHAGP